MPAKTRTIYVRGIALSILSFFPLLGLAQESNQPQPLTLPGPVREIDGPADASIPTLPRATSSGNSSAIHEEATAGSIRYATDNNPERTTGEQPASFTPGYYKEAPDPWGQAGKLAKKNPKSDEPKDAPQADSKKLPEPKSGSTLSLPPPDSDDANRKPRSVTSGLGTMFASLCLVLGFFFLAVWILRKAMPKSAKMLPSEVVEILGRAPLGGKQQVHLVRIGNKMLLVALYAGGAETLTEITDPLEVDRLAGLCAQQLPHSSTNAFKQIFQQFAQRGDAEPEDEPTATPDRLIGREVVRG